MSRYIVKKNTNKIIVMTVGLCLSSSTLFASSFGVSDTTSSQDPSNNTQIVSAQQQQTANKQAATSVDASSDSSALGDTQLSQEAFSKTVRNLMPMTPDQIKSMRKMYNESQKAASEYPGSSSPKPTSSSVIVNLSPGETPPVIRLRAGFITSLVFLDSTGQPWPITAY